MKGVHRAPDRVFRPWRNGGGETAEILAYPPGAGFDGFEWRLSTAIVASDGPFSTFPGVDRVLAVVEGGPMVLTLDDASVRLDAGSAPFAFDGGAPCLCRLEGAPVLDFNVMVRRPRRAWVVRGPWAPPPPGALAAYALLLEPRGPFGRLDLVDLDAAGAEGVSALAGAQALAVSITR